LTLTLTLLAQIAFLKECGDDDVCEPELGAQWLNVGGLVVGSSQSVRAQVNASLRLINAGETAYSVTLNVTFPRPSLHFAAASPEHSVCPTLSTSNGKKVKVAHIRLPSVGFRS